MARYRCTVCNYILDEEREGVKFEDLPENWRCPVCNSPLSTFVLLSAKIEYKDVDSTVSEVMVDQMAEWGIQYVFGIPGTSSLGVVDAIRQEDRIKYIQVRHEQTAAMMASAYGKLTGHLAACLTVAGPGATNLATGLYDAKLDHAPVLAITGMVQRQLMGPGSFQEIDQHSFFEPLTVFNKILMSPEQTINLVTLGIKHALLEGGVSHIGMPNDVQKEPFRARPVPFEGSFPNNAVSQPMFLVLQAAQAINKAEKPVILSGFGAMGQGEVLAKFAEKIDAPITTTFRGKGVIDEDHDLYVGSHGTIGSTASTVLMDDCDLLIVIGSSFSDMTQIPPKKTVQIDLNPLMIARQYPVEVGLLGNSAEILPQLLGMVQEKERPLYREEIKNLKQEWLDLLEEEADGTLTPVRPQYIIKVLNEELAEDAIITLDTGENGWWFGRNFWMKKTQKMLMSGYLGTMGFGLPAALAAQLVYPDRQVVCITGDGGFSMVMADFLTAVKYELPVKLFLMNNHQLAMIMQEQKVENYPNWQTQLYNPDFASYARECGGTGINVKDPDKLRTAVSEALDTEGPVLVDIETDPRRFIQAL
ncbi:thiamine pyrophosphate-binding protein [Methanobacterium sp. CWC-01]|uniref:thiamine pyrophosphate-dependent enzyme n=1 Tax=Methanobacterium aridiramus TaxID=2584467 RepID=UPI002578F4DC|nr:thiamine pyrophosphate-dependent enzyme [Methanobacterium sp. CWC-01]WJI08931.1 thiamine pyrophosphate-binding protein [Methanobacterium sp. CWC-01]